MALARTALCLAERIALTAVAGTLIYADLARRGDESARRLASQGADEALKVAPTGYAQHGAGWTDDMFMMASILARSGSLPGRAGDLDHLATMLISYAGRLQREDGVFVHFTEGRIPGDAETDLRRSASPKRSRRSQPRTRRARTCSRFIAAT